MMVDELRSNSSLHRNIPVEESSNSPVVQLAHRARNMAATSTDFLVANLLVALKSKPLTLLVHPAQTNLNDPVKSMIQCLVGDEEVQYHPMLGHAWWAENTGNTGLYATAQARLIDLKLLDLIEEAWLIKNRGKSCVAYLQDISSGELSGVLTQLAFQLKRGGIIRLPTVHLNSPIPFPPNLFLVASIATTQRISIHNDLFRAATIIDSSAYIKPVGNDRASDSPILSGLPAGFLNFRIRNSRKALSKLNQTVHNPQLLLLPVIRIFRHLIFHSIDVPSTVVNDVILYLANAWGSDSAGLFSDSPQENAAVARDIALTQYVLMRVRAMRNVEEAVWHGLLKLLEESENDWAVSRIFSQSQVKT